jgi:hypothetical protein
LPEPTGPPTPKRSGGNFFVRLVFMVFVYFGWRISDDVFRIA